MTLLTDGGDMRGIKLTLGEPAQHTRLPDPRVPEHEQPEQHVVLFGHDNKLKKPRGKLSSAPPWSCRLM